ncbi:MAG: hypothetical protein RL358_381 [Pseudomonadota bacterium]|jgi:hypothetical protein
MGFIATVCAIGTLLMAIAFATWMAKELFTSK